MKQQLLEAHQRVEDANINLRRSTESVKELSLVNSKLRGVWAAVVVCFFLSWKDLKRE